MTLSRPLAAPRPRRASPWRRANLLAQLVALLIFCLTNFSTVHYGTSDSYLSLLVAQAILEQGTTKLDAYAERTQPPLEEFDPTGQVLRWEGHYYYYPPLGPSLVSLPIVAAATALGEDMTLQEDILQLQELISSALATLIFVLFYLTAMRYLTPGASLLAATITVMGSTVISTIGTALWNLDFSTFFVALALLLLVRYDIGESATPHPYALGFLLCAAYLCRPTAAAFIAPLFAYLLYRDRQIFLKTALAALLPLLCFMGYSWQEFGQWLPPYYDAPARVAASTTQYSQWTGLWGLLVSPGRGLLVFSPFLLPVALGALLFLRPLSRLPLFWLSLLWFLLHMLLATSGTRWWGGHAYGPRILTDVMPALLLLTVLVWRETARRASRPVRLSLLALYLVLGGWSLFVHSYQGLYNPNTGMWNGFVPNIDFYPEYLFDWRYPQFLASNPALCARNEEWVNRELERDAIPVEAYRIGEPIPFDGSSRNAVFAGWSPPEAQHRWSLCQTARVYFLLPEEEIPAGESHALELLSGVFGEQQVTLYLNGSPLGTIMLRGFEPQQHTFPFDSGLLRPGDYNVLEFYLPDATPIPPAGRYPDPRPLGLALSEIRILREAAP